MSAVIHHILSQRYNATAFYFDDSSIYAVPLRVLKQKVTHLGILPNLCFKHMFELF